MTEFEEHIARILASGGAAYPVNIKLANGATYTDSGMTLRDYFAGQALASIPLRSWEENGKIPDDVFKRWAIAAYATADAMLEARK